MKFEWDEEKAAINKQKHGVRFEDAQLVFLDPHSVTIEDNRFDYGEQRFVTFGRIEGRLFVVVHTDNEHTETIRIISARKANARERRKYADS